MNEAVWQQICVKCLVLGIRFDAGLLIKDSGPSLALDMVFEYALITECYRQYLSCNNEIGHGEGYL